MKHELYVLGLIVLIVIICYIMMVSSARLDGRTFHEDLLPSMYGDEFPEDEFVGGEAYDEEVEKGAKLAKDETLVIGGLAYNLTMEQISMLERRIDYISDGWKRVIIFVYGLDSKEQYREFLIDWAKRDTRVILVPKLERSWKKENVFVKMAHLRNALHQYIDQYIKDSIKDSINEQTFFLTMDYDIGGPISKHGILHARYLLEDKTIGVVYANGIVSDSFINTIPGFKGWCFPGLGYSYYDDLALIRNEGSDESKLTKWFSMAYGRGAKPLHVTSAYGGAGLMRPSLLKHSYDITSKTCEHHSFNRKITDLHLSIVVDPSFLLLAGCQGHHLTRKVE